jgi:hypothetical protein
MYASSRGCPHLRPRRLGLLFPEVETDWYFWKAEGFSDPVNEVALVGKVDGRRVPDEQGEGRRFDCDLCDVVEYMRAAPASGRGIGLDHFPYLMIELTCLDSP